MLTLAFCLLFSPLNVISATGFNVFHCGHPDTVPALDAAWNDAAPLFPEWARTITPTITQILVMDVAVNTPECTRRVAYAAVRSAPGHGYVLILSPELPQDADAAAFMALLFLVTQDRESTWAWAGCLD